MQNNPNFLLPVHSHRLPKWFKFGKKACCLGIWWMFNLNERKGNECKWRDRTWREINGNDIELEWHERSLKEMNGKEMKT